MCLDQLLSIRYNLEQQSYNFLSFNGNGMSEKNET